MTRLSLSDVRAPQHIRTMTKGQITPGTFDDVVMDIYTGWLIVDQPEKHGDVHREPMWSLVPLAPEKGYKIPIQGYPAGPAVAIVSASLSSYGDRPQTCAVDSAKVDLELQNFVTHTPPLSAVVLVLTVETAIQDGTLNRVAYQVTVLAPLNDSQGRLFDYDANVVQLDPPTIVPNV